MKTLKAPLWAKTFFLTNFPFHLPLLVIFLPLPCADILTQVPYPGPTQPLSLIRGTLRPLWDLSSSPLCFADVHLFLKPERNPTTAHPIGSVHIRQDLTWTPEEEPKPENKAKSRRLTNRQHPGNKKKKSHWAIKKKYSICAVTLCSYRICREGKVHA